ncbi:hypothetical protein [Lysinibacillus sp. BPa_S21]|uniref:hypothetical protein n=1 Tax=Lysinibacillus sp. BPa_S21 TaxID=2932478 RepID=UPI0020110D8C|nr:hypothetical protein [Lysinibacillus sp. BPa_S21]MCL1696649.1 hypothetical protein [Lysinibacillus sp. BPa_S21]
MQLVIVQQDFNQLSLLAFALDITPTTTAAVLIRVMLGNKRFMQWYLSKFLLHLDQMKIREIYRLLKLEGDDSWTSLILLVYVKSGIIILYAMEKAERVVRIIKLMFEEKIDEAIIAVIKMVPKKKEHNMLKV